jgi:hypothetical protein
MFQTTIVGIRDTINHNMFLTSSVHIVPIVMCFCIVYLRRMYSMLPVSLNSPFLIPTSIFSNVYLHKQYIILWFKLIIVAL